MEADEGRFFGGPGVGLTHTHRHAFLQGQEVLKLRVIAQHVDQGRFAGAGVAEDMLHALRLQHLQHSLFTGHHLRHLTNLPFN